jgi:hypothetical protein
MSSHRPGNYFNRVVNADALRRRHDGWPANAIIADCQRHEGDLHMCGLSSQQGPRQAVTWRTTADKPPDTRASEVAPTVRQAADYVSETIGFISMGVYV